MGIAVDLSSRSKHAAILNSNMCAKILSKSRTSAVNNIYSSEKWYACKKWYYEQHSSPQNWWEYTHQLFN